MAPGEVMKLRSHDHSGNLLRHPHDVSADVRIVGRFARALLIHAIPITPAAGRGVDKTMVSTDTRRSDTAKRREGASKPHGIDAFPTRYGILGWRRYAAGTGDGCPSTTAPPRTWFCAWQSLTQNVAGGATSVESSPIT
jgi:hypothetical protein